MKKWQIVILIILVLYLVSTGLAKILSGNILIGDKIAVIPITGQIISGELATIPFQTKGASSTTIINFIEKADKDENIKGIILDINSPGGTVVASREIANAVKATEKPTTALIREIGTSGAYWIASAADKIVADPMSITGSIGVISSYLEFSDFMEKYGISYEQVQAGEFKDVGSPFRKMTEEEKVLLQKKLNLIYKHFIEEVAKNRDLSKAKVESLATGMFYLGEEAYKLNLVDYLGGKELAINITKQAANITDATLITYQEKRTLFDLLSKISAYSSYFIGKGIGSEMYINLKTQEPFEIAA